MYQTAVAAEHRRAMEANTGDETVCRSGKGDAGEGKSESSRDEDGAEW